MNKALSKKQRIKQKQKEKPKEQQVEQQKKTDKAKKIQKQQVKNKQKDEPHVIKSNDRKKSEGNISVKSKQSDKKKKPKKSQQLSESEVNQKIENDESVDLNFNNILEGEENVQVSFLVSEINQNQYHSMKTILQKFARITGIMSSQWADAIIGNAKGGNAVLADDDQDQEDEQDDQNENSQNKDREQPDDQQNVCSGVINILSYDHKLTKKLLQKIIKSIQNKKLKFHGQQNPSIVLSKNKCSLLICERAINLPSFVVKSMHEVLVNDLKQLQKTNNSLYAKICGNCIFGITEVQISKNSQHENLDMQEIIFSRFEDYLFLKESICWWVGEVSPNSVRKMPLHKLYFIIKLQKYFSTVAQIQSLLQQ